MAFLVATGDGWPSPWALLLIPGFIILRPVAWWFLDRAGHGEILVLLGITMAVAVGAGIFESVGLKPDLGALVAGLMLSGHPRASELSTTLLGFKDLFLVGFFLSIGLAGTPPLEAWIIGVALLVAASLRTGAFLWLFTRFRLRSRTSLHSALTLSTYSEFGLIVGAAAVSAGYITQDWVSTVAVAVAGSFIGASWADGNRYRLYERWSAPLAGLERRPSRSTTPWSIAAGPMSSSSAWAASVKAPTTKSSPSGEASSSVSTEIVRSLMPNSEPVGPSYAVMRSTSTSGNDSSSIRKSSWSSQP